MQILNTNQWNSEIAPRHPTKSQTCQPYKYDLIFSDASPLPRLCSSMFTWASTKNFYFPHTLPRHIVSHHTHPRPVTHLRQETRVWQKQMSVSKVQLQTLNSYRQLPNLILSLRLLGMLLWDTYFSWRLFRWLQNAHRTVRYFHPDRCKPNILLPNTNLTISNCLNYTSRAIHDMIYSSVICWVLRFLLEISEVLFVHLDFSWRPRAAACTKPGSLNQFSSAAARVTLKTIVCHRTGSALFLCELQNRSSCLQRGGCLLWAPSVTAGAGDKPFVTAVTSANRVRAEEKLIRLLCHLKSGVNEL